MTTPLDQSPVEILEAQIGSLKPVIDAMPESVYDNPTWRGVAYFSRDTVIYAGLLSALVFVSNVVAVLAIELVMAFVVSALFIVGHDSAHGALFKSKRLNQTLGKISFLPSFHVFEGWILGHNRIHHAFTVRQGYDFVWHPVTPEEFATMGAVQRLVHRFEWSWPGLGAYYLHQIWWKKMMISKSPARWVKAINRDRWIVGAFFAAMVALFSGVGLIMGDSAWAVVWLDVRTVLLPFIGFGWVIGAAVHVHHIAPEIRWWKRSEWTKFKGQMEGTTVLRVPWGLNFFLHWIMIHVPHHVDMRVPMYHLDEAAAAIEQAFPGTVIDKRLRLMDLRRNTKACKLYDFDEGRWYTYGQARRRVARA